MAACKLTWFRAAARPDLRAEDFLYLLRAQTVFVMFS